MLTLLPQQSTDTLETGEVWDHGLENIASTPTMVTEDYVEKLSNEGIVRYAYNNARLASDTTASSNEKMNIDPSNIFHHMHTSDIAYVVIQGFNKEQIWKTEWEQNNKGCGEGGREGGGGGGRLKKTHTVLGRRR